MLDQRQKLFTIGQFAAIHGVTKKTLMWYDEMGLVTPAVIGENGYRYYTYQQSSTLETVLMLRELNVSIPEIKGFMEHRSAPAWSGCCPPRSGSWRSGSTTCGP